MSNDLRALSREELAAMLTSSGLGVETVTWVMVFNEAARRLREDGAGDSQSRRGAIGNINERGVFMDTKNLTIRDAQTNQPWTVPYSPAVETAKTHGVPHILASHNVMHAAKSVGKLAAVFEALDHRDGGTMGTVGPNDEQLQTIKDMAADLMTEALRFANLYKFDLATELVRRVGLKNGTR